MIMMMMMMMCSHRAQHDPVFAVDRAADIAHAHLNLPSCAV